MSHVQAITKSDAEIQRDVLRELNWDTRVEATDVGVEVQGGVVTLSGTVSSWAKRLAAAEAVHRVQGVLDVADDVTVRLPGAPPDDTEIAHAVRNTLIWDVFVPDARIRSTVSNGIVTLDGDVDTWAQKDDAERAIRNLAGVRGVVNVIGVKAAPVAPAKVRLAIEEALERQAEREAKRIWFDVEDGVVRVFGAVRSWPERIAVIGAAKGTPGVKRVEDKLRIETSH
jgi:osmotically-inducible protein OsmY